MVVPPPPSLPFRVTHLHSTCDNGVVNTLSGLLHNDGVLDLPNVLFRFLDVPWRAPQSWIDEGIVGAALLAYGIDRIIRFLGVALGIFTDYNR